MSVRFACEIIVFLCEIVTWSVLSYWACASITYAQSICFFSSTKWWNILIVQIRSNGPNMRSPAIWSSYGARTFSFTLPATLCGATLRWYTVMNPQLQTSGGAPARRPFPWSWVPHRYATDIRRFWWQRERERNERALEL